MHLHSQVLFQTNHSIMDADVSTQMTAILQKGKGEHIVTINDVVVFTVSPHAYIIRILDEGLVIYDGKDLYFYTLDGMCTQQVYVGSHIFDLLPMKDAVACTYRDQGVYGDSIGREKIVLVKNDGTVTSQLSFALEHHLDFDIRFSRVKPYACMSSETNRIIYFNQTFQLVKTENCPFELGNAVAMSYQYPYFLFLEENRWICLHENGTYDVNEHTFSANIRSHYHRGPFVFLEIVEQEVIGYSFMKE